MKKYSKILFLLTFIVILTGCNSSKNISDSVKFKNEYESLNGKTNDNNKKYKSITIEEDNSVTYIDSKKTIEILEKGTGVI